MRVLLVEDSELLRRSISDGLRKHGCTVDCSADGEVGLHLARTGEYDVLVLDIMLPKLDGLSLLKSLRDQGRDTHVLLLTARDTVPDRVAGLRAGADDYLVKPFAFEELLARVQALVRRKYNVKQSCITIGSLKVDLVAKSVTCNGNQIPLPPREYALLEYLAMRQGHVVSRTEIEAHIYDSEANLLSNVVDAAVYSLRRKLDSGKGPSMIQTRRGMGYVLTEVET